MNLEGSVGSILTSDLTARVPALPSLLEYVIDIGMLFEIEMNSPNVVDLEISFPERR